MLDGSTETIRVLVVDPAVGTWAAIAFGLGFLARLGDEGSRSAVTDRRENVCYRCRKAVLWATFEGKPIPLERCKPGSGDLASQEELLALAPSVGLSKVVRCGGSGWRKHDHPSPAAAGAFSAGNQRKGRR